MKMAWEKEQGYDELNVHIYLKVLNNDPFNVRNQFTKLRTF